MKWYTCIVNVPKHVTQVQYFHTRAENPDAAENNAVKWMKYGDPDMECDVEFVFAGRLWPEEISGDSDRELLTPKAG
jgi:hypothetical protein